jgi:hypothetical protein
MIWIWVISSMPVWCGFLYIWRKYKIVDGYLWERKIWNDLKHGSNAALSGGMLACRPP